MRLIIILVSCLLMFGLWAALTLRLPSEYGVLTVGQPSPFSIQAPRSVEFISEVRTAERRAQAENRPENLVYTTDAAIPRAQRRELQELLGTIGSVRTNPALDDAAKERTLTTLPSASLELTPEQAQTILSLSDEEWEEVRLQSLAFYDRAMAEYNYELDEDAVRQLRERSLPYWVGTRALTEEQQELVLLFVTTMLRPNRSLDQAATEANRREAAESVEPVQVQVLEGESIVRVGEIVRPETIEKLEATGALPRSLNWLSIGGHGLLAAMLTLTFMLYLSAFQLPILRQPRSLLVIAVTVVVTALAARFALPFWDDKAYAFPLATVALTFAVVFNGQLALAATGMLAVVIGLLGGNSLALAASLIVGCAVAIMAMRSAERLLMFVLAGAAVAGVTVAMQIGFWMVNVNAVLPEEVVPALLTIVLFGAVNGSLSVILALGLFNLVGRAAGVVTPLQLMELAHPSQPLLRKLIREAPGTYYHSVAVGNLAEAAAEAIGADALLLRVAAYYHDIGKTLRPFFFTDNQTGRENVHNDLDPRTSAQIIVDHVREGVKMARAAGLPQQIIDFISTHHGTHLIKHFYQLALQQEDTVDITDFRYPGPRPATREQGILMLADSVEATVRSKAQNGKLLAANVPANGRGNGGAQTINELVGSIIDDRLRDGELDQTPLTLRDLVLIRQAFVTSLQSIYHPRTDYAPQVVKAQA